MQRKVNESQQAFIHDLGHLREFHASIIDDKNNELNYLASLHENYMKLSKKLQDENFFLLDEMMNGFEPLITWWNISISDSLKDIPKLISFGTINLISYFFPCIFFYIYKF